MPICKKCGNKFPNIAKIDGKWRSLHKRSYCLQCSSFGLHNRKRLTCNEHVCLVCGTKSNRRSYCPKHYAIRRRERLRNKIHEIIGIYCKICGYGGIDKTRMLDLHHIDQSTKSFNLCIESLSRFKFEDVMLELRKCVLLCCRCHREYHVGLIDNEKILDAYVKMWTIAQVG